LETSQTPTCRIDADKCSRLRERLPEITERIIADCGASQCYTHVDYEPIPSQASAIAIVATLREILFPGYFSTHKIDPLNLRYSMGQTVSLLFDQLARQITDSIRHDCFRYRLDCSECEERGYRLAIELLEQIPEIRRVLATDVRAAYEGDPAARSHDEVIFSYPGILAIAVHRVAHRLWRSGVPLLPHIMSEYAHSVTGIDIHPGAQIGEAFVIDHGTGVVIGESTVIGHNVRLYQGVTLGALSLPRDAVERLRGQKRHPTIEEDVIIYAGATILGGETVIGARCVIGGNVWLTESVPADTRVMLEAPRLVYRK